MARILPFDLSVRMVGFYIQFEIHISDLSLRDSSLALELRPYHEASRLSEDSTAD